MANVRSFIHHERFFSRDEAKWEETPLHSIVRIIANKFCAARKALVGLLKSSLWKTIFRIA